jgi:hypothetical protein
MALRLSHQAAAQTPWNDKSLKFARASGSLQAVGGILCSLLRHGDSFFWLQATRTFWM